MSSDRSGRARSPDEQLADSVRDVEREGWTFVGEFRDNDRGASRYSKQDRPAFERLKAAIEAGDVDVVVAWEASRYARDLDVYTDIARVVRGAGVLYCYSGRTYDLNDPADARIAGFDAVQAEYEAGVIRERSLRGIRYNLHGGDAYHGIHGTVQFGYRRVRDPRTGRTATQVPDLDPCAVCGADLDCEHPDRTGPAAAVRLMYERLAAGGTAHGVARELNALGYRTGYHRKGDAPADGLWTAHRVKQQVYDRPGYLGLRVHKGEVVGEEPRWQPLVDRATYDAVQGVFAGRSYGSGHETRAVWLLSGIATCGECGGQMRALRHLDRYKCDGPGGPVPGARKGCVTRRIDVVEASVVDLAVDRLRRPDVLRHAAGRGAAAAERLQRQLDGLQARLDKVRADWDADLIETDDYARKRAKIEYDAEPLRAQLAALRADVPAVVLQAAGDDAAAKWEAADVETRRALLRLLFDEIQVHRAPTTAFGAIAYRYAGDDKLRMTPTVRG